MSTTSNSLDHILNTTCLTSKRNHEEALRILKKVATMMRPIMKAHGWKTTTLAEFYTAGLLGMNTNNGWKIQLCLRYHSDESRFLPWEDIIGTMLHELAHNIRGPHDEKFYKALNDLNDEYDKLLATGYTGEGFDSTGHRLGTRDLGGFGPGGKRIGGALGGESPTAAARAAAVLVAEKRRQINEMMLPAGGRKLGGSIAGSTSKGFWEQWHSPGELAAMAAERRAKDRIWCGSSATADNQESATNQYKVSPLKSKRHPIPREETRDNLIISKANGSLEQGGCIPLYDSVSSGGMKRKTVSDNTQELADIIQKKSKKMSSLIEEEESNWSEWSCPACTLLNNVLALQCECCLTQRPIDLTG